MESSARAGTPAQTKKSRWLWWFLGGITIGVLGTIFLPDLLRPYLPQMFRGEDVEIAGIVEAKSREPDRLLLTIGGDAGAVLVTYTTEIPEMDLLIEPGDSVVLAVREYAPFVEDPSVRRVQKARARSREPSVGAQSPARSEIERRAVPRAAEESVDTTRTDLDEEFRRDIGPAGDTTSGARRSEESEGEANPPTEPVEVPGDSA